MPQPTITTKLVRAGQPVPAGASVPIGDDGTTLELVVPAGREITAAELLIQVPDDSAPGNLIAGAAIVTSSGNWPDAAAIAWLTADWRARRALVRLTVTLAAGQPATHLRVRLADAGPWVLATPVALVDIAGKTSVVVNLPGLAASRVMIEPVIKPAGALGPEDYTPTPSVINSVTVTAARRPPAFTVSLAPGSVLHHEPALLPASAQVRVREPLVNALRKQLPDHAGGGARIVLTAPVAADLRRVALSLSSCAALSRWRGGVETLTLPVEPGADAFARVELEAHPTRFVARVRGELRAERALPVSAPSAQVRHAHRCTPDSALAQGFAFAAGATLLGVDLWLAARTAKLRGELAIHADLRGSPAAPPLAVAAIALDDPAAGIRAAPRWLVVDLPAPVALAPGARCWVSLTLASGEALWFLDHPPAEVDLVGLQRRDRGESWVPRDMSFGTGPSPAWAVARPRLRSAVPPAPEYLLRRGSVKLPVTPDAEGFVRAEADELAALNLGAPTEPIELVIRSASAGRIVADMLRVDLPTRTDTWNFGSPP